MFDRVLNTEAATGGVLWEKVFLKISQNSEENTPVFCKKTLFYRTPPYDCFYKDTSIIYLANKYMFKIRKRSTWKIGRMCLM